MKKHLFPIVSASCMLLIGLLTCYVGVQMSEVDAAAAGKDPETEQSEPVPQEERLTVEQIRTYVFTDLESGSDYDTACYMAYYNLLPELDPESWEFCPDTMVDRAAVAETIYRMSGETASGSQTRFADVTAESGYAAAVAWCDSVGILDALELREEAAEATVYFDPAAPVSRAQLAAILQRAAVFWGYPAEAAGDLADYADGEKAGTYTQELVWATETGLYRTLVREELQPNIAVSRMQLSKILIGLRALGGEDALAEQIHKALPARQAMVSAARTNHEAIQAAVDSAAKKYGADGIQVAVVENGVVTDTYAYGWATKDVDPMTADHKMRVASLSKIAVGLTAMLLREDGVVDLDQDISEYWGFEIKNPKYPNKPITLRSMLTHTSSILNAGDDVSRAYTDVSVMLRNGKGYSGAVPGDIGYWSYNNFAYGVLGMTLELAADSVVDGILQDGLYTAMDIDAAYAAGDIENTDLLVTLVRQDGSVSRSVEMQKGMHIDPTPGATGTFFAGGLTISAADFAKLLALLAEDGCYEGVRLMSKESVAAMETRNPRAVPGGSYQAIPMRYWPELYGRDGVFFHTGSAYGVYNCATYDPVTGDGVVVLTVGASGSKDEHGIYRVCAEINDYIYEVLK